MNLYKAQDHIYINGKIMTGLKKNASRIKKLRCKPKTPLSKERKKNELRF